MVLGFGDPTKGMTRIWGHFVILGVCECVILRPQIMLKPFRAGSKADALLVLTYNHLLVFLYRYVIAMYLKLEEAVKNEGIDKRASCGLAL